MPQPAHLDPTAYAAAGGPVGALLIHGYTGSVVETRPMGEYLAARGVTVCCPLLPGHGTEPEDLIGVRWQAWADEATSSLRDLQGRCASVFVGGLSSGALLALWLGAQDAQITGLIPMTPAMKLQNRLLPLMLVVRYLLKYPPPGMVEDEVFGDPEAAQRIWCYDTQPLWGAAEFHLLQRQVRRLLDKVHQPILLFQGRLDNWLSPEAAQTVYDGVAATDKTLVWLEHSGHNLLVDGERESVWVQSYEWMMRVLGVTNPAAGGP